MCGCFGVQMAGSPVFVCLGFVTELLGGRWTIISGFLSLCKPDDEHDVGGLAVDKMLPVQACL